MEEEGRRSRTKNRQDQREALRRLEEEIAERRHAEELLRSSEERYRQLVENASDIIYETDASGRIRYINPSAEKISGYTMEEIIGKNYLEFLPPEYHEEQSRLLGIQFVKKTPTSYHETPILLKNGKEIWLWQSVNLILEGGEVTGFRVIARDITDRKKAEEALKKSEQTLRAITSSTRDAIIMVDAQGRITFWNEAAEQILGWEESEVLGRDLHSLIAPESYREASSRGIEHFRTSGQGGAVGKTLELTAVCKDNTEIPIELSLSAVNLAGSWHAVGIMRDITERRRTEAERKEFDQRLQQTQKLESLGILAGGIAHDFNNLLMGVLGNLDLSLLELPQGSRARSLIEKAVNAARRAADLTRQMLAYSGKGRYVVGRVDINELVRENEHLIRAAIPKAHTLDLTLTSTSTVIEADGDQVKQVVMNLVTNAAEAMGGNPGRIGLKTSVEFCDETCLSQSRIHEKPPAGRFVCVEVKDTGCGMSGEVLQRIFEPFFSTKFTGRGLGMSAVIGIVSSHGGAIFIDSTPGRGSSVRVMFPACEAVSGTKDRDGLEVTGARAEEVPPGTVLVVDDEEQVREVCSVFVEHLGYEAMTASDGAEAVELFREHADRIACVLLDLTMPRLDGISAFREMKGIRGDVPVILSSGYSEQDTSRRFSDLGLAGFIQKPYTLHELKDKMDRAMRRSDKKQK